MHGGGRAIDAELAARGEPARFVDGLRITDRAALDAVVAVLAGRNNTALVAAIGAAGGRAVGLTGADGLIGLSEKAAGFTSVAGDQVDLGLVGHPVAREAALLGDLLRLGYMPVVASIGVGRDGSAAQRECRHPGGAPRRHLHADRLLIAGGTAGVLDSEGHTMPVLTEEDIAAMTASGAAHSGMIAKLAACVRALDGGVPDVAVVAGPRHRRFHACHRHSD